MRILITGAKGQLGRECLLLLQADHVITGVDVDEFDIADAAATKRFIDVLQPEVIINCAAFTQVDRCETEREMAWQANVDGPAHLALAAAKIQARLIHVSTDYVFDGLKTPPAAYSEAEATQPLSWYGQTKLEGEKRVRQHCRNHLILRTAWLYGFYGRNFLKTILRAALANPQKPLRVVNDQFGSPTWAKGLAEQIQILLTDGRPGVYHATAQGHCTWYDLAVNFFAQMEIQAKVHPCTTADYPTAARRPNNSILTNQALQSQGLDRMRPWQEDLEKFVSRHKSDLLQEAANRV